MIDKKQEEKRPTRNFQFSTEEHRQLVQMAADRAGLSVNAWLVQVSLVAAREQLAEEHEVFTEKHLAKQATLKDTPVAKCLRRRAQRLKESGLCRDCGQVPPAEDRTLCRICLESRRARERKRARDKWNIQP